MIVYCKNMKITSYEVVCQKIYDSHIVMGMPTDGRIPS